jgi:hypothetical protein
MRLPGVQIYLLIALFTMTASCCGQSLTGHWKVQKVKLVDMMHHNTFTVDLTKPDKVKKDMLSSFFKEPKEEGVRIDTAEIRADIQKKATAYQKGQLTLSGNNKFNMVSNGLIVPTSLPGRHFGNSLTGMWTKSKDLLTLSTGNQNQGYRSKFKILQLTGKSLKLQQISQGFKGNEMLEGSKNEIEFVRQ